MTDAHRVPEIPDEPDPWNGNDWNPGDGDSIAGTVLERETVHSRTYDRDFEVLTIENGSGEPTRVSCARAHLAALLIDHDPQVGDQVAIRHWDPAEGKNAHRYAMRVTKAAAPAGTGGVDEIPF